MGDFDWSEGGKGAFGGAASGAAAGAALGPWGAGAGALIGGVAGLFGGGLGGDGGKAEQEARQKEMWDMARNRPDVAGMDYQGNEWRQRQGALYGQLEAMSRGQGPSLAGQMLQSQADRGAAQQAGLAAAAGGRGVNQGAALRNAAGQQAALQMNAAQEASMARTREQMSALQQMGGLSGQARGMDQDAMQANMANQHANWNGRFGSMGQAAGMFSPAGPSTGTSLMAGGFAALPMLGQQLGAAGQAQPAAPAQQGGQGSFFDKLSGS